MQSVSGFFHKFFIFLLIFYFAGLFLVCKQDYFFGDAISSTARLSNYIYDNGIYFYPQGSDPGHPPTYSVLLSFCWKIFGKSLWISHAYGMLWCVFIIAGFRKTASVFLDYKTTNYATLLVLVHPTFVSQNAMMLNTAMLMGCLLWATYFLLTNRKAGYILILTLMVLSHLQGAFFLASLAVADFFLKRKEINFLEFVQTRFITYFIPFVFFIGWLFLHYYHAGWFIISPDYSDAHESNSLWQIVKGLGYCVWRFSDYGMLVPLLIYAGIKYKYRRFYHYDTLLWISLSVTVIIMSFFLKNTIAHRYFLAFELIFLIIVIKEISQYALIKRFLYLLILCSLCIGNFMYYPGKTIADANIRYRDFFKCYAILSDTLNNSARYQEVFSKAPIANATYLLNPEISSESTQFQRKISRINKQDINALPCVISSNVCAEFTPEENDKLSQWYGQSFEYGAVYINLYINPTFYAAPANWHLREASPFENWMIKFKKKYK